MEHPCIGKVATMTASTETGRGTRTRAKKSSAPTSTDKAAASRTGRADSSKEAPAKPHASMKEGHTVTVSLPLDRVASAAGSVVMAPVAVARKVLPAKGGLPLYLGLGALGAAGVLEWPVALGVGIGYAVLRRHGPLQPEHTDGQSGRADS
jgi:hypothetical protein